jgi:hypothetical protein
MNPVLEVEWRILQDDDPDWQLMRVLYAYFLRRPFELLYVGKAWGTTVSSRLTASDKMAFWKDFYRVYGKREPSVMLGEVFYETGSRFTQQLLADIESLIIKRERPWGNIQSRRSRIARPGMRVRCFGAWKWKREYRDD